MYLCCLLIYFYRLFINFFLIYFLFVDDFLLIDIWDEFDVIVFRFLVVGMFFMLFLFVYLLNFLIVENCFYILFDFFYIIFLV